LPDSIGLVNQVYPESNPLPMARPSTSVCSSLAMPSYSSSIASQSSSLTYPVLMTPSNVLPSLAPSLAPSPGFRLPSVRDIYWPSASQQQYAVPPHQVFASTSNPPVLPPPISISAIVNVGSTTTMPSNALDGTSQTKHNCHFIDANDLAETFDERLTSDDPFHDAELRSLNDVVELNHLYSAIGTANTIRR
jgi:hypothetical protein